MTRALLAAVAAAALGSGAAAALGSGAAATAPGEDGFVDPPVRSEFAPRGPLRVLGGVTPISAINANDANGLSPLEFSFVTIRGVVQVASRTLDPFDGPRRANWVYVHDGTGGVVVTRPDTITVSVAAGDSVEVQSGVFTQRSAPIRGTRTLDLAALGFGSITVRATGRPLRPARDVPADSVDAHGAALEGDLVRVGGLTLVSPAEWPATGASAFVRATDGVTTLRIRIDEDTDLDGISPPAGTFAITGFVSQDDSTASATGPFLSGHFVYPRSTADISQGDGSGTATVTPAVVLEGASGVALSFTVLGQVATLETVEVVIPASWTWETPGSVSVTGTGFLGASASADTSGGTWVVTVTDAAVDSLSPGTLQVQGLRAPPDAEASRFVVRTAVPGGTPAEILDSPVVQVVSSAAPGDVVINELYPRTSLLPQGLERSEFVELRNRTTRDLVIAGWTLADIGRTPTCALDARWAFPAGTVISAGGFVVVCQTALDAPNDSAGFRKSFRDFPPGVPLFEMHDSSVEASTADHAGTPNMILLDPSAGNDQMQLLGGPNTNVGQCESANVRGLFLPFQELVVLRNALGAIIDAVEYREPGPCLQDLCGPGSPGGGGPNDAYPYGAPKVDHTLGRDAASTDTDVSAADLRPSSTPTPGRPNVPVDTVPPAISVPATNVAISASVLEIRFDEPVLDSLAVDPRNYALSLGAGAATPRVLEVLRDPSEPLTHYFLATDPLPAGGAVSLRISGITDIPFDGREGNAIDTTIVVPIRSDAAAICAVQASDARGFSPLVGDTVTVAGYVTILPTSTTRFSIWVQEPGPAGCGVNVFSFDRNFPDLATYDIRLNDLVRVRGRVTEFISSSSGAGSVTELVSFGNSDFYRFLARGLPGPEPRLVTTGEANDEALEGTLVRTEGTVVNSNALAAWIDDGTGAIQVFQNFSSLDLTRFTVGDRLDVTGVITQFDSTEPYFDGYELVPQNQESIVKLDRGFTDAPRVTVASRVLVPQLGERMDIVVNTPRRSDVIVEIYDGVGRKVTTFHDGVGLGEMRFRWDGRGQDGEIVPPGVYLCHVRTVPLDGGDVVNHTAPIVVGLRLQGGEAR